MTEIPDPATLIAAALDCPAASLAPDSGLGAHPKWDSIGHLTVMLALERDYGVELSDETIRRFATFAAIDARYRELTGART